MRNLSRAPRLYELMTIIAPDVPEEELPGSVDRIAAYITDAGGTVNETLRDSPWGRRRLAYPIRYSGRDVRDGFYTVFHFELDPAKVDDVERELRLNDRVIRYLVTHYTPAPIQETEEGEAAEAEAPAGTAEAGATTAAEPAAEAPAEAPAETQTEQAETEAVAVEEAAPAEEAVAEPEAAAEEPVVVEESASEAEEAEPAGESAADETASDEVADDEK